MLPGLLRKQDDDEPYRDTCTGLRSAAIRASEGGGQRPQRLWLKWTFAQGVGAFRGRGSCLYIVRFRNTERYLFQVRIARPGNQQATG